MADDQHRKYWQFRRLISEHALDKLRAIDCTFGEFEAALDNAEVVENELLAPGETKEVILITGWTRPLHLVVIVDEAQQEERVLTIYEPDPARWTSDFRQRRR